MAGEVDGGNLHAEAKPEVGDFLFAGEFGGKDLALDTAMPEAARNKDAVHAGKKLAGTFGFNVFGIDPHGVNAGIGGCSSMGEGFVDGLVGVLVLDVFTNDGDGHPMLGSNDSVDHVFPLVHVGGWEVEPEEAAGEFVHFLALQHEGHFVDGIGDVLFFDDGFGKDVAKEGEFLPDIFADGVFGAANEDLGLDADFAQFGHALLGGFGFEFTGSLDVGEEGDVDEENVIETDFEGKLADGFDEGETFDVPSGASDFGDDDVAILVLADFFDAGFDFVGDVRDNLNGLAEVIATALFAEDFFVDLTGGEVVASPEFGIGEPFVVTKVKVGFGTIFKDINFAVLIGAHRARIDVEVGVELLQDHPQAAVFEEGAECGSGQTFPKRAHNAASNKNIFHDGFGEGARARRSGATRKASSGVSTPIDWKVVGTT